MNRRTFLASLFIGGLMLKIGLKADDASATIKQRPPIVSVWLDHGKYSTDRGETWLDGTPPNGASVERWNAGSDCDHWLQSYGGKMPTYNAAVNGVYFEGNAYMKSELNGGQYWGPGGLYSWRVPHLRFHFE